LGWMISEVSRSKPKKVGGWMDVAMGVPVGHFSKKE